MKVTQKNIIIIFIVCIFLGAVSGFWGGFLASQSKNISDWMENKVLSDDKSAKEEEQECKIVQAQEQSAVIDVVKKASPAVVSIVGTKELPEIRRHPGYFYDSFFRDFFKFPEEEQDSRRQQIAGGTGFIVSSDGYIVTNRHVVSDDNAEYTVIAGEGEEHEVEVLARDSIIDLAILKIEEKELPYLELGDSSNLQTGQKVIAIGNALGEFRDTVSTGVISGLSRSITASGGIGAPVEHLSGVIQTDASINPGNSGGPLLNIEGRVIGVNTAMAQGAENIGFAIPVNEIKDTINDVKEHGRIIRAWLGVRHIIITKDLADLNNLEVDHGALITRGANEMEMAVIPGSPADKAGLESNDIILEVDGEKITKESTLANVINEHDPGDKVTMTILREGEKQEIEVELGERNKE